MSRQVCEADCVHSVHMVVVQTNKVVVRNSDRFLEAVR